MTRTVAAIVAELAHVEDEVRWASLGSQPRTGHQRLNELSARENALVRELRAIDVRLDLSAGPTPA